MLIHYSIGIDLRNHKLYLRYYLLCSLNLLNNCSATSIPENLDETMMMMMMTVL